LNFNYVGELAFVSFDCIVIGSGPGGYVAAVRAAQLGMTVAVIERDEVVGGRCLNYACIPAKSVLRSADILTAVREAGEYGIGVAGEPTVDFGAIGQRRTKVITTLTGGVSALFKKNNVELISGEAALTPTATSRSATGC
jgi:dihydrolipoamide dehydrogenase